MLMGNSHLLYEYKTKRVVVLNLDNNKNVMRENTFRFLSSHMGLWLVKGLDEKTTTAAIGLVVFFLMDHSYHFGLNIPKGAPKIEFYWSGTGAQPVFRILPYLGMPPVHI